MALLATLISDANGIVNIHAQTTYGGLNQIVPTDGQGRLDFAAVLNAPAPYSLGTYERAVILLTGGFAD